MKVEPITEKQAQESGLRRRGIYDFEVLEAKDKISSSNNEMIETRVKLYDSEGRSFNLFDYLVSTPGMAYKVRHYAVTTGQLAAYEKGELHADDQPGKTGRCQVGIQPAKDGYPAKNVISDYVPLAPGEKGPLIASVSTADPEDEIPF